MPKPSLTSVDHTDHHLKSLSEKRREQIEVASIALFAERGYFQTTVEDISNQIGVGKGLIYRYYRDKNDVLFGALRAVLDKYKKENIPALIETVGPLAALRRILTIFCSLAQDHKREVILAYRSTRDLMPEQREQIMAIELEMVAEIGRCLQACIDTGLMRQLNVKIMAYQFVVFGNTWALKHWALEDEFELSEFIAVGEDLLIAPFLTKKGSEKFSALMAAPAAKRNVRTRKI